LAKVGNLLTETTCYIQIPPSRTGATDIIAPVPDFAALISRGSSIRRRVDTGAIRHIITLIASSAGTVGCECSAIIIDRHTNTVTIEYPVIRTLYTCKGFQIPLTTSTISWLSTVRGSIQTSSINQVISLVTSQTITILIKGAALVLNRDAYSICIEYPSLGAGQTHRTIPTAASSVTHWCSIRVRVDTTTVD
jgi:hypothetical protein